MKLYCDLDGVLADLDGHYAALFGAKPDKTSDNLDWKKIENSPDFFRNIPPLSDAYDLWHAIAHLFPTILTGVPTQFPEQAAKNKREWVAHHLGPDVPVITTRSRDKCTFCQPGDILIDDWEKYKQLWLDKGGLWITHVSARDTINQLRDMLHPHDVY